MELWNSVRQDYLQPEDGITPSLNFLSQKYGIDYRVIKKILANPAPPGYQLNKPRPLKKLAPHTDFIRQILDDDHAVRDKQRHIAQRIYERLCNERGYDGSARAVRDLVRKMRRQHKEVFIPLQQPMSQAQVDFFEVDIILHGQPSRAFVFTMALCYSDAIFCMAFPFQKQEAWLEGHKQAFLFFGGVPRVIVYDNDKSLVTKILAGHERETTQAFQRLQSFYGFQPRFCNAYAGNEKGVVENMNKYAERHFFTPCPHVRDFAQLNHDLLCRCAQLLDSTAKDKEQSKRELLKQEYREFMELPAGEFEACCKESRQTDSLSLIHLEHNRYSVPDIYANRQEVTVKGFWDKVQIFSREGELIAEHPRLWQRYQESLNPLHYLNTLQKKPGALDHGRPFNNGMEWPKCFQTLRQRLESEAELQAQASGKRGGGKHQGTKQYIRVLKLLLEFSMRDVCRAIEKALRLGHPQYEVIRQYCYPEESPEVPVMDLDGREHLRGYEVELPRLTRYDGLLNRKEANEQGASTVGALPERVAATSDAAGLSGGSGGLRTEEVGLPGVPEAAVRTGAVGAGGAGCGAPAQGGEVPSIENAGDLRLPPTAGHQRTIVAGTGERGVCREAGKRDSAGRVRNGQNASGDLSGLRGMRARKEGAVLEHGRSGDDASGGAGSEDVAEYAAAAVESGSSDPGRDGIRSVYEGGGGVVV